MVQLDFPKTEKKMNSVKLTNTMICIYQKDFDRYLKFFNSLKPELCFSYSFIIIVILYI